MFLIELNNVKTLSKIINLILSEDNIEFKCIFDFDKHYMKWLFNCPNNEKIYKYELKFKIDESVERKNVCYYTFDIHSFYELIRNFDNTTLKINLDDNCILVNEVMMKMYKLDCVSVSIQKHSYENIIDFNLFSVLQQHKNFSSLHLVITKEYVILIFKNGSEFYSKLYKIDPIKFKNTFKTDFTNEELSKLLILNDLNFMMYTNDELKFKHVNEHWTFNITTVI